MKDAKDAKMKRPFLYLMVAGWSDGGVHKTGKST
jgi:hypothetical protein